MNTTLKLQRGFSLVSAIFLLVVIAALGAFSLTLSSTQLQSAALDVQGSRAYQAARAGIEWGAFQVRQAPAAAFAASCRAGGTAQAFAAGALANTLAPFTVNVGCVSVSAVEGGATIWIYTITSTATRGTPGGPDYVERQLQVKIQ